MKTIIEFDWWDNNSDDDIPENIKEELEENAIARICELRKEGYFSGELVCESQDENGNDAYYSGRWYCYEPGRVANDRIVCEQVAIENAWNEAEELKHSLLSLSDSELLECRDALIKRSESIMRSLHEYVDDSE